MRTLKNIADNLNLVLMMSDVLGENLPFLVKENKIFYGEKELSSYNITKLMTKYHYDIPNAHSFLKLFVEYVEIIKKEVVDE